MLIKKGSFNVKGFAGEKSKDINFVGIWNYTSMKGKDITSRDGMETFSYNGVKVSRDKTIDGTYVYYVSVKFDVDTPREFISASVSMSSDSKYLSIRSNSSDLKSSYIEDALNKVMF